MDFLPIDYVLLGLGIFLGVVGLFRGFSGELGSACGWGAGAAAVYYGWGYFGSLISIKWVLIGLMVFLALVAFGLVRVIVSKLVHKALSQPTDAILGLILGLLKLSLVVFLLLHFELGVDESHFLQEIELVLK